MNAKPVLKLAGLLLFMLLVTAGLNEVLGSGRPITGRRVSGSENVHLGGSHGGSGHEIERSTYTSPCIHQHREGVIFPIDGQPGDIRLQELTLKAHPHFFSCMVRNFIINATATFTLENSSGLSVNAFTLTFPFSTHALYGDHNGFRDIQINVDDTPIPFGVALDSTLYEKRDPYGELYFKGRPINMTVHPLLSDATDVRELFPFLVSEGFDMVAYWQMSFAPHEQRVVQIEYTSNSNDFSSCCREVADPAGGVEPYYYYFDLSNAGYWQHPTDVHVLLPNSPNAIWSTVPQLDLHRTVTESTIEFWGQGVVLTEDLALPAEPSAFGVTPRYWPADDSLQQTFSLEWIGNALYYTRTEVTQITGTTGVVIEDVELPLYLSETSPTASFSVTLSPAQLSTPAYFDVYGVGSSAYSFLHRAFVRVPITGHTVTGHDLAITDLAASGALAFGTQVTITGVVENQGSFDESSVLASLYVNRNYVENGAFPGLKPGEAREIEIGWTVDTPALELLEVEIEPIPGEVKRRNNVASILITRLPNVMFFPLVFR